jgi:hypothetical protein
MGASIASLDGLSVDFDEATAKGVFTALECFAPARDHLTTMSGLLSRPPERHPD